MLVESYNLFFSALSNKNRLLILDALKEGKLSVNNIIDKTGLEQSQISHNLKCLKNCAFVTSSREGKNIFYSRNEKLLKPIFNLVNNHLMLHCDELCSCNMITKKQAIKLKRSGELLA